ncbi:MAG TPA: acetyl-CoA carboxylase carboxyltransferase subunit alpha [Polyangiaceae bacterium]|jgi:acetyl-CoA carboxylase carboxyl transferase subunit alpha|nr:acetyl-CoA carboxylase carboxyltransferase subunit alpha [Polyangiaceae bacterium]
MSTSSQGPASSPASTTHVLPFEKPVVDVLARVREMRELARGDRSLDTELRKLEERAAKLARQVFAELTPWQKVQLSRHPNRPYTLDYITRIFEDFKELHGDRVFGDDPAVVAGFARLRGRSVIVVGHQKGRGAKERVKRNFGMPHPEGYRKARRIYEIAGRFGLPIITLVDTPGAFPGIGAEERGQSEAIGACLATMSRAPVPIVSTIIGEGGSGGALALAVANRVLVVEYGTYSVITPEGCASILWKDGAKADQAAERMKITAPDLLRLGVVERIVDEPAGGAHQDHDEAARLVGAAIMQSLAEVEAIGPKQALIEHRYQRFRALGALAT